MYKIPILYFAKILHFHHRRHHRVVTKFHNKIIVPVFRATLSIYIDIYIGVLYNSTILPNKQSKIVK